MSGHQTNVWQSGRPKHTQSTSRTPQSRSGTGSPQPSTTVQTSRQESAQQQSNNVWAQKGSAANERSSSNPSATDGTHVSSNGFNGAEVKTALASDTPQKRYSITDSGSGSRGGGGAWASKSGIMANGQSFFVQLAKQVAGLENGG